MNNSFYYNVLCSKNCYKLFYLAVCQLKTGTTFNCAQLVWIDSFIAISWPQPASFILSLFILSLFD